MFPSFINSSMHYLSTYYVLDTMLSSMYVLLLLIYYLILLSL